MSEDSGLTGQTRPNGGNMYHGIKINKNEFFGDNTDESQIKLSRDQKKRIEQYLNDSDTKCKRSSNITLILLVIIFIIGTFIVFLSLKKSTSYQNKGTHLEVFNQYNETYEDYIANWFYKHLTFFDRSITQNDTEYIDTDETEEHLINVTETNVIKDLIKMEEKMDDFQPIYRNPLMQRLYSLYNNEPCSIDNNDDVFKHISFLYGEWKPSKDWLKESKSFSWASYNENDKYDPSDVTNALKRRLKQVYHNSHHRRDKRKEKRDAKRLARLQKHGMLPPKLPDNMKLKDEEKWREKWKQFQKDKTFRLANPILSKNILNTFDQNDENPDYKDPNEVQLNNDEKEVSDEHPFVQLLLNPGDMKTEATCINDRSSVIDIPFDHSMNLFRCYLIVLDKKWEKFDDPNFGLRVGIHFDDIDMEQGFDYVNIMINHDLYDSVTSKGSKGDIVHHIDREYLKEMNTVEMCFNVKTDSTIMSKKFKAKIQIDYTESNWTPWSECKTLKPIGGNKKYLDGRCGVGVQSRINDCKKDSNGDCYDEYTSTRYCIKEKCENVDNKNAPKPGHFNGFGRVDPTYPDPYKHKHSSNNEFDIKNIIDKVDELRHNISKRYPDVRILTESVIQHGYMTDSKLRLGIKLARSLILGNAFIAGFTGTSNTAGHENMFYSTWPMQLQSILRPFFKKYGYKGASFVVRNNAQGGKPGTNQKSWCIKEMIGDDVDVVFWESKMLDHKLARSHTFENDVRSGISLKSRPLYHMMVAGKDPFREMGSRTAFGKQGQLYEPFMKAILPNIDYIKYGAGFVQFTPANTLIPASKLPNNVGKKYGVNNMYISWHPSSQGHRVYAEMVAYFYLSCLYDVLNHLKPLILEMNTKVPIKEMIEMLEDPPRKQTLPDNLNGKPLSCDPYCINSTNHYCVSGYYPLQKKAFMLNKWNTTNSWTYNYENDASYQQSILWKTGGQTAQDFKYSFKGNQASNELTFYLKRIGSGYVQIDMKSTKSRNVMDWLNKNVKIAVYKLNSNDKQELRCMEPLGTNQWITGVAGCVIQLPNNIALNDKFYLSIIITNKDEEMVVRNIRLN